MRGKKRRTKRGLRGGRKERSNRLPQQLISLSMNELKGARVVVALSRR